MYTQAVQRLRISYAVDGPLRYLSVLDMGRLWERLLRRAGFPLAHTQGFNPHPRLAFATPLPVGYSSEMELLDVHLGAQTPLDMVLGRLAAQCPAGLTLQGVTEVALDGPALQGVMRTADFAVSIWSPASAEAVKAAVARVLASDTLPHERVRAGRTARYDLRPLLLSAAYAGASDGVHQLTVNMVCSPQGVGRPEDLVAELDIPVAHWAVCRTALHWESSQEE
jgi:radical SAM-linked protein